MSCNAEQKAVVVKWSRPGVPALDFQMSRRVERDTERLVG
jgi:hypothetical protein